jgi:hypothetical protein
MRAISHLVQSLAAAAVVWIILASPAVLTGPADPVPHRFVQR